MRPNNPITSSHTSIVVCFVLPTHGQQCSYMTLFKSVYPCKNAFVCRPVQSSSVQHMAIWCTVSAPCSLLICLTHCSRYPFAPFTNAPPSPPPPLLVQLPLAAHTRGRANLLFSASNLPPPLRRLPHFIPPPPFLSFSSPLTKSLFRLHSAENHMECDITRAGSRERGNGRAGERLACQVSVRWCQQKSTLGGPLGGDSRAGWKLYPFFFGLHSHLDNQGAGGGRAERQLAPWRQPWCDLLTFQDTNCLPSFTLAHRCCTTPSSEGKRAPIREVLYCSRDAQNSYRSSNSLFLPVAGSPNLLTRLYVCQPPTLPLLFSGWTLQLCCEILGSIPSLTTHPALYQHTEIHINTQSASLPLCLTHKHTHALKYPSPLINGRAGVAARQGGEWRGKEGRTGEEVGEERRGEKRKGKERRGEGCSCGFGVDPCSPLLPPLSISSLDSSRDTRLGQAPGTRESGPG